MQAATEFINREQSKPVARGQAREMSLIGAQAMQTITPAQVSLADVLALVPGHAVADCVVTGNGNCYFLKQNGQLFVQGNNNNGQLGVDTSAIFNDPKLVDKLKDKKIIKVHATNNNAIVLTEEGELYGFGLNADGELGLGHKNKVSEPTLIAALKDKKIKDFTMSDTGTIFYSHDEVFSCGKNEYGNLGQGHKNPILVPTLIEVLKGKIVIQVAMNSIGTIIITENSEVYACGLNHQGYLGMGREIVSFLTPELIPSLKDKNIGRCVMSSCIFFLSSKSGVYVCGGGGDGQMGIRRYGAEVPTEILVLRDKFIINVATASCTSFVTDDGKVFSCGDNAYAGLGIGHECGGEGGRYFTPEFIAALSGTQIRSVYRMGSKAFYLTKQDEVLVNGFNVYGELGYSGGKNITTPKVFKPLEGKKIVKIAGDLGENKVLMFLGAGGEIYSWKSVNKQAYQLNRLPFFLSTMELKNIMTDKIRSIFNLLDAWQLNTERSNSNFNVYEAVFIILSKYGVNSGIQSSSSLFAARAECFDEQSRTLSRVLQDFTRSHKTILDPKETLKELVDVINATIKPNKKDPLYWIVAKIAEKAELINLNTLEQAADSSYHPVEP